MGWLNNMNDVVLDDAAFEKAIADFSDLAVQLQSLRDDIVDLLDVLKKGLIRQPAENSFVPVKTICCSHLTNRSWSLTIFLQR